MAWYSFRNLWNNNVCRFAEYYRNVETLFGHFTANFAFGMISKEHFAIHISASLYLFLYFAGTDIFIFLCNLVTRARAVFTNWTYMYIYNIYMYLWYIYIITSYYAMREKKDKNFSFFFDFDSSIARGVRSNFCYFENSVKSVEEQFVNHCHLLVRRMFGETMRRIMRKRWQSYHANVGAFFREFWIAPNRVFYIPIPFRSIDRACLDYKAIENEDVSDSCHGAPLSRSFYYTPIWLNESPSKEGKREREPTFLSHVLFFSQRHWNRTIDRFTRAV